MIAGGTMADLNLIDWAAKQPEWVRDGLRRIAVTAGFTVSPEDRAQILERIKYAASGMGTAPNCEPITPEHLSQCAETAPAPCWLQLAPSPTSTAWPKINSFVSHQTALP
jgi:hypothetical protein